jgi:biopolymer transport protein ExbD
MGAKVGDQGDYNAEINIIPLVDIMLVLLIIFIITVPVVQNAVRITMPTNINKPTESKPEDITLAIDSYNQWYWNDQPVDLQTMANLAAEQVRAVKFEDQPTVKFRVDKKTKFAYVSDAIRVLQQTGLLKVDFLAERPLGG